MPNITLSMDEKLIEAGRRYAHAHNTTLNGLVRDLLTKTVAPAPKKTLEQLWEEADKAGYSSNGVKWTREDAYDV